MTTDPVLRTRRTHAQWGEALGATPAPSGETWTQVLAAEEVCPPGDTYAPGTLDFLALFLTHSGRAHVQVGPHSFIHQPGSLVAVASGSDLRERVDAAGPWHVRYLLLSGPWASQMDAWLRRQDAPFLVCPNSPARRRQVFSEIVDLALTEPDGWQWRFLSGSAEVLGGLYSDARPASLGDALLGEVARLVDGSPADRLAVGEMAARLGLSPRQLLYRFGLASGEPLASWIRRRRVSAARRLLSQGMSVSAVAEQLGYANPYHFSRVFKAVTGETPSAYRETALQSRLHVRAEEEIRA